MNKVVLQTLSSIVSKLQNHILTKFAFFTNNQPKKGGRRSCVKIVRIKTHEKVHFPNFVNLKIRVQYIISSITKPE